jgi:hypothetical protein
MGRWLRCGLDFGRRNHDERIPGGWALDFPLINPSGYTIRLLIMTDGGGGWVPHPSVLRVRLLLTWRLSTGIPWTENWHSILKTGHGAVGAFMPRVSRD